MFNLICIILEQVMIYLPLALGSYVSFSLLKVPDLSLETSYLMGAFAGGFVLPYVQALHPILGLCIVLTVSIMMGVIVGLIASSMTIYGKIPHLLSSILTFGLFQGIFLTVSSPYVSLAKYTNVLMHLPYITYHPELCTILIINIILLFIFTVMLRKQLGYSFVIYGYNRLFFKHFKISQDYIFIVGIIIAHGCSGLAGFLFAQTNSLVELNMGVGKSLFCITALILGKTIYSGIQASIFIPVFGVGAYFILQQFLLQIGFCLQYFTIIQSLLVFIILLLVYKKSSSQIDQLGL